MLFKAVIIFLNFIFIRRYFSRSVIAIIQTCTEFRVAMGLLYLRPNIDSFIIIFKLYNYKRDK